MLAELNTLRWRGALAAGVLGLGLLAFLPAAGLAAEEDEETFEQSVIRGLLGGKSGGDLDYRERSPLVIPPSRDLPAPDNAAKIDRTPAWPRDPDRRKQAAKEGSRSAEENEREGGRPLRPDELRRGTVQGRGRVEKPAVTLSDNESSRPLRPSEYGDGKGLFSFWASKPSEAATFTGEPTRSRMTEPPPGYRTPSAAQPYAPPKDAPGSWFKSLNIFDRGLGNDN